MSNKTGFIVAFAMAVSTAVSAVPFAYGAEAEDSAEAEALALQIESAVASMPEGSTEAEVEALIAQILADSGVSLDVQEAALAQVEAFAIATGNSALLTAASASKTAVQQAKADGGVGPGGPGGSGSSAPVAPPGGSGGGGGGSDY